MSQDTKELPKETKEEEAKRTLEEEKERPKEVLEEAIKQEEIKPFEEKPALEEAKEVSGKVVKIKPKRKPRPKPKPQVLEVTKKWEDKWIKVNGENVLFVPSGFEIMTENGWRPVMMRADKIKK